ncbi:PREDICTED: protein argonaute 2 [Fragaria vesca subsp. vesca]|uniref:protein argonaute 2 n=1 Tax=Fragaria vesca subsp. vesca TaxID=101020 RepID=UPI0002C33F4E|nr:PREDICTED: protein argonaute 2 [Fragaria vesca subsp. vesca]
MERGRGGYGGRGNNGGRGGGERGSRGGYVNRGGRVGGYADVVYGGGNGGRGGAEGGRGGYGGGGGERGRGGYGGGGERGRGGYGGGYNRQQPQDQRSNQSRGQPGRSDQQSWRSPSSASSQPQDQQSWRSPAASQPQDQQAWRPSGQPPQEQQSSQNRGQSWRPNPAPSTPSFNDALVSGVQSLKISKQTPSPPSLNSADKLTPARRPDKGGERSVKTVGLRANHFNVSYDPQSTIMHYDIRVKPVNATRNGRPVRIMKSDLAAIRNKLSSDNPAQFPLLMTAYDGEKNIFSAVTLPTGEFRVEVPEEEGTRLSSYIVTIKLVNELKLCKLREYLNRELSSIPRDIMQGMDLVMKENPSRRLIPVGRSFYPAEFNPDDDLGQGTAAFRGFQHSLRLTSQGPALCLDYSVLAFYKRMPVIDFLHEKIWGFSLNDFRRFRREVENVLRGLKVTVTHRPTKQKYVIKGLTDRNAGDITFDAVDVDGLVPPKRLRLVDYFRDKYQDIKYKNIPCLDLGKNGRRNDTPLEFCVLVEGQRYPKEHLGRDAAIMLKNMSLAAPRVRESNIRNMVRSEDGPCGGGIIQNFGIEVNMNMTQVTGRVIGPPELRLGAFGGKVTKVTVDSEKCHWNLVGKSLVEGKPISRWAVLDFSSQDRDALDPNQFIPKLIARCNKLGMRMEGPRFYETTSMRPFSSVNLLRELLETVNGKVLQEGWGHLQLLVCVMSRKDPGYKYLKWICETQIGIVTQCCLSKMATKASDQFLSNLALKINAKLGGSNVELIDRLPLFEGAGPVMFVGADVNHPAARNTTSPSIAAVVATINWPAVNRYAARVRPQYHRKESILNFGDMVLELVKSYYRMNKVLPEKIVVFRDGVSEGQFDMVLNEELVDLKRALGSIQYYPTITLIVAQKRHHTRLFQENGSSNVSPGTVVDTTIVHPFEFDFYLCSHYGSLGTSKPTHYHVLWDEHSFTSDQLQKLIYDLCYTFARCTKPVSLVPPVYYADLVAYRGRLYHETMTEGLSPGSITSSSSASSSATSTLSVGSVDDGFYRLHADLEDIMFFI